MTSGCGTTPAGRCSTAEHSGVLALPKKRTPGVLLPALEIATRARARACLQLRGADPAAGAVSPRVRVARAPRAPLRSGPPKRLGTISPTHVLTRSARYHPAACSRVRVRAAMPG